MHRTIIMIPCWGRSEIVKECYKSISKLGARKLWLLSEEDPEFDRLLDIVDRNKSDIVIQYKNSPLGEKMNAGITFMLDNVKGWDYLMNWGSDDIVDPALAKVYAPYIAAQELYFGINSVYVMDTETGETKFCMNYNAGLPIGAGRMIHRALIEKVYAQNDYLYANAARSGLDGNSNQRLRAITEVTPVIIDSGIHPYVVDLKYGCNINAYRLFSGFPVAKRSIVDEIHGKITLKYGNKHHITGNKGQRVPKTGAKVDKTADI